MRILGIIDITDTPVGRLLSAWIESGKIWQRRLRSVRPARLLQWAALMFVLSVGLDWIAYLMQRASADRLAIIASAPAWLQHVALVVTVFVVLSGIAYFLIVLQAWLPGLHSLGLTIAIGVFSHFFFNPKIWLTDGVALLYPPDLREAYLHAADTSAHWILWGTSAMALAIASGALWMKLRVTRGLLTSSNYRQSQFFRDWSEPGFAISSPWEMLASIRWAGSEARGS